jgi:hypothetical protein
MLDALAEKTKPPMPGWQRGFNTTGYRCFDLLLSLEKLP